MSDKHSVGFGRTIDASQQQKTKNMGNSSNGELCVASGEVVVKRGCYESVRKWILAMRFQPMMEY